jgi:hypothetical protein
MAATADKCEKRADNAGDAAFAKSLRQRARQLRGMMVELDLLENDPIRRTIHDRPDQSIVLRRGACGAMT